MKTSGIVRKVDELGRVVLPVEMRRLLNISEKDKVEISLDGENVILCKYKAACVFCGSNEDLRDYRDRKVCIQCLEQLQTKR